MKRSILFTILVCMAASFIFAENFTVVSVTGRVERESGTQRIEIIANDVLDGEIIIHTGVGASIVLRDESGSQKTIAAGRNGSIAELTKASTSSVRVGGTISRTDTSAVSRTTAQVGTASARASVSVVNTSVLSTGTVNRTSDTAATIGFTTTETGTAYYLVTEADAAMPENTAVRAGTSLGTVSGAVSGKAVTLTAGAKDIYVVLEDSSGSICAPLKITAAAFR